MDIELSTGLGLTSVASEDLKSSGRERPCGFDSHRRYSNCNGSTGNNRLALAERNTVAALRTIDDLIEAVRQETARENMPIAREVYHQVNKDPLQPILFAGSLDAPVCFFGRDLGRDEVRHGQPLIGAGGRLVREGILRASKGQDQGAKHSRIQLEKALEHALLTNTVPYKPPGNKAYSEPVKERFRPFLVQLLTRFWKGRHIITLGTEAFHWFEPYVDKHQWKSHGLSDERFESVFTCSIPRPSSDAKTCTLLPLPHPSPLNRRWFEQFPSMLDRRLAEAAHESRER
jgi:uracil-DNA glycosylase